MSNFVAENPNVVHVVLIVQFGSVRAYNGKKYVSNAYNVTRLFINSEIDEIIAFKKSFLGEANDDSAVRGSISSSTVTSLEAEFLNEYDFSNIADISEIKQVKSVVIVGKINAVSTDKQWYYYGCDNCKSKVDSELQVTEKEDGSVEPDVERVFKCNNQRCSQEIVDCPIPRFKIPITVQDCTEWCHLLCLIAMHLISYKKLPRNCLKIN